MCSSPTFEVFTSLSYTDYRQTLEIVVIPKFSFRYLTLSLLLALFPLFNFQVTKDFRKEIFEPYVPLETFGLVVGTNGLEPSTSRLSGVRSNHLSYEPILS